MRDELRNTLVLALGTGTSSLLRIAYVVYAARELGPAAYADLYAALSIVFMFGIGMAPISGTVSRFASLYQADGDLGALSGLRRFARSQVLRIVGGLVVLSPLLVLGLRSQFSSRSIWVPILVVATLPFVLLVDLPRGLLRGGHRFGTFSVNLTVEAVLRLGLSVALLARVSIPESPLLAYMLAALLTLPVSAAQTRAIARDAEAKSVDAQLLRRFGANFFLVAFIGAALQNIDVLAARRFFPDLEAGLYSAASSLAKVLGLVYLPFGVLALPTLTARFSQRLQPKRTLAAIMCCFAAVALATVGLLAWQGERLLGLLFGPDYVDAHPLIAPLGLALTLALLTILLGQAFTAMSRFEFIPFYFAALIAELGILWWMQGSPLELARGLLVSQLVTFVLILTCFVITVRAESSAHAA